MENVLEQATLIRSEVLNLYRQGFISLGCSSGIHCNSSKFKEVASRVGTMEMERHSVYHPIETSVIVNGTRFFAIWKAEEFEEYFPNINPETLGVVSLENTKEEVING